MIDRLHHLNLLVRDLEAAKARWAALLGRDDFVDEPLPDRGVLTSRVKLGETWLVLVCPLDPDSPPGRRLAAQGEGVFLLSLAAGDLDATLQRLATHGLTLGAERRGIEGWRVRDLAPEEPGPIIQLCETPGDP